MIARRLARKGPRKQNEEKKKSTIAGIGRLRGSESVGAKLALLQENSQMMQRVGTIPKRRPVITRGKVHCLRKDFQGRLGAGRRAEGKKKKFPRASALANRELEPETFKCAQLLHAATYWESCFKGREGS